MRRLPTIVAIGFIAITLWRVGQFAASRMAGGWSGWVFSVFLGVAVYAAAYYTRDSITIREDGKEDRRNANVKAWAWRLLILSVLADGLFNLAEVWQAVKPPALNVDPLLFIGTAVFGVFPTLVAAGMGALQGHVDRLPKPPANERTSVLVAFRRLMVRLVDSIGKTEETHAPMLPAKVETVSQPVADVETQPQPDAPLSNKDKILTLHKQLPGATHPQIAQMAGVSRQYVSRILSTNGKAAHNDAKEG